MAPIPHCSSCSKRFESGVEMVPPPGDGTHHLSQLEIDAAAGGNRGRTEIGTDFGTRRFWMEPRKRRKTWEDDWGRRGWFGVGFLTTDEHRWSRILRDWD